MNSPILAWFLEHYDWRLSLLTGAAIFAATFVFNQLLILIPTFKGAHRLNQDTYRAKMQKPVYAANQKWNRKWASLYLAVIFGLVMPFCLTLDPQPWWRVLRDIVVILLFYDFFYYLTHRFLFHHNGITWIAFSWINLHNHDLWTATTRPSRSSMTGCSAPWTTARATRRSPGRRRKPRRRCKPGLGGPRPLGGREFDVEIGQAAEGVGRLVAVAASTRRSVMRL